MGQESEQDTIGVAQQCRQQPGRLCECELDIEELLTEVRVDSVSAGRFRTDDELREMGFVLCQKEEQIF